MDEAIATGTRTEGDGVDPFFLKFLRPLMAVTDWLFARFSRVENRPFFDVRDFAWVEEVERSWRELRDEANRLHQEQLPIPPFEEISPVERKLTDDRGWKVFFFVAYGIEVEANCRQCPETWRALRRIPGLVSAFFSILEPGKELPVHRGIDKGVLRYHLALCVPGRSGECALTVNGETRLWVEGQSLLFDDTFPHSARNRSGGRRVILFADVARPLRFPANLVHHLLIRLAARSPYVRRSARLLAQWEDAQVPAGGDASPRREAVS